MGYADLIAITDRAVRSHLGGVAVTYTTEAGVDVTTGADGEQLTGMFDETYALNDQGQPGLEQVVPVLHLRLEDLPTDPRDENPTVTIDGVVYTIRQRPTDGVGGSIRLILRRSGL